MRNKKMRQADKIAILFIIKSKKRIMKKILQYSILPVFIALVAFGTAASVDAFGGTNNYQRPIQGGQQMGTTNNWSTSTTTVGDNASIIAALQEKLRVLLAQLRDIKGSDDVNITTKSAVDIEEEEATLRAYLNSIDNDVTIWFEYGEDRDNLDEETSEVDYDEDDEGEYIEVTIDDLDEDTRYYFRVVAEDEDGDNSYGSVFSFRTDDEDDDNEEPDVDTEDADDIDEESAELNGSIDMNDFNNGYVFFVWGEDEDSVEDVDSEDEYGDIDEDGDDLQKEAVDSDLDGDDDYSLDIDDLDDDTTYYFRIAVEYEDDDTIIEFGDVEEFTTDED